MKFKKILIYFVSILLAIFLMILVSSFLYKLGEYQGNISQIIGTAASILGFFLAAILLAREATRRIEEAQPIEGRPLPFPPKWKSFGFLIVLTLFGIAFGVIGVFYLAVLIDPHTAFPDNPVRYISLNIVQPFLAFTFLVLLHLKVRTVRMLDIQKHYIKELAAARNDWHVSPRHLINFDPQRQYVLSRQERSDMRFLLEAACRTSLLIASSTGLHNSGYISGVTSVLFVANHSQSNFIPVACAEGTPEYQAVLASLRPSFLDPKRFAIAYNSFQRSKAVEAKNISHRRSLIIEFRDSVQQIASTAGVVYAIERKLAFDNAYDKCLTTSFEFLNRIPEDQKNRFKFRQVIGIPINMFRKKVAVLLLFSSIPNRFYITDKAYWIVGHILGSIMQLVIGSRYLEQMGIRNLLSSSSYIGQSAETNAAIKVMTTVKSDFSQQCWEDPRWQR